MTTDTERLKALIDLVAEGNIAELQIADGGVEFHIVLREQGVSATRMAIDTVPASVAVAAPAQSSASQDHRARGKHVVVSPMPGTFYRAAGSGAKPLVEMGTPVQAGMPVCIVEAMKILNEVSVDQAGKVVQILVEDGQAVEQGQELFVIEPEA